VLKVEADRFQHLDYAEDAFKTESRAVLGEYNKNSANPVSKLFEVMRDSAYTTHTYKHTTMGFIQDIEDMPNQYAYSKLFFDRWYRPERTTIIMPATWSRSKPSRWWKNTGVSGSAASSRPPCPWSQSRAARLQARGLAHADPAMGGRGFHAPAFSVKDKDQAALATLLSLSFGRTSPLYKRFDVQNEQKVDQLFDMTPDRVDRPWP